MYDHKSGVKCCPYHWGANNRKARRVADKSCECRGECGCREKVINHG